jgi:D-lyxose ketol-isomerase
MIKTSCYLMTGILTAIWISGCAAPKNYTGLTPLSSFPRLVSPSFYKPDGSFDQAVAKQAYFDMMRAYHYPIPEILKTDALWTADFMQNDFAKLGMGGVFWKNVEGTYGNVGTKAYKGEYKDQKFGYLGHEMYLLPGQMLPEHCHLANGDGKGFGPKMETWHIRYGSVEFFSEYTGDSGETLISNMPANERPWGYGQPWFKSKYVKKSGAGEIYSLNDAESWHFMRAGKNGAIVSEYATYHNDVKFSKPGMQFGNSKAAEITKVKK